MDGTCSCKSTLTGQRWQGEKCDKCVQGYWGTECEQRCSSGCYNVCNKEGRCSCKTGYWTGQGWTETKWTGEKCDKCESGYWGCDCEQRCSNTCRIYGKSGTTCHKDNGHCDYCVSGYWGSQCQQRCSHGCYKMNVRRKMEVVHVNLAGQERDVKTVCKYMYTFKNTFLIKSYYKITFLE